MLQWCCCLPVNRTCFNIADVRVSKQSSHRSAISSIDLAHQAFFSFFFFFTEKRLRFKRRLSEKPVSTGNLQGHALDMSAAWWEIGRLLVKAAAQPHFSMLAGALTLLRCRTQRGSGLIAAKSIERNTHKWAHFNYGSQSGSGSADGNAALFWNCNKGKWGPSAAPEGRI